MSEGSFCDRSDEEEIEIDDNSINRILVVTQTPPAFRKHPAGDRTGDHVPRARMSAEVARVINDSLFYYEQDIWTANEVQERLVSVKFFSALLKKLAISWDGLDCVFFCFELSIGILAVVAHES